MIASASVFGWLPRAGGGPPFGFAFVAPTSKAPPRRRGSTHTDLAEVGHRRGSPAQAGVHPAKGSIGRGRPWLPRAGGGPPAHRERVVAVVGAPPRRRGSTHHERRHRPQQDGSPAQAGVHLRSSVERGRDGGLPRAGGGPPQHHHGSKAHALAPPRRRGSTRSRASRRPAPAGSPAQAGVHPIPTPCSPTASRLPRAGGGPPRWTRAVIASGAAPPRRRGSTLSRQVRDRDGKGSPAQAGVHLQGSDSNTGAGGLPRAGGGPPSTRRWKGRSR